MSFDFTLFNFLNGYAGFSPFLDGIAIFFARYAPYLVALTGALFILRDIRWRERCRRFALLSLSVIVSWGIIVPLIGLFFHRQRPSLILDVIPLIPLPGNGSFPSSHATFFFALAMAVFLINRKWGIGFLIMAGAIAVARIFVGVHWPTDILAGAVLGIVVAYAVRYVLGRNTRTENDLQPHSNQSL